MAKTSLTPAEGKTACGSYDFSNVTDLLLFTDATWYGDTTAVATATGLNSTMLDQFYDPATTGSF